LQDEVKNCELDNLNGINFRNKNSEDFLVPLIRLSEMIESSTITKDKSEQMDDTLILFGTDEKAVCGKIVLGANKT
jgi:hypothetical protein